MKLSTGKIIGIGLGTLVLTLLLAVLPLSGVLRSYLQLITLGIALSMEAILLGWIKPRAQAKLTAMVVILAAVVYQSIMFTLLGTKLGYITNVYRLGWQSLGMVILPTVGLIVLTELLRGQLVEHGKGSLAAVITTGVILWLTQICLASAAYNLAEGQGVFLLLVGVAGPALLTNILLTYIAYAYDYRINIAYRLIMELPAYLLPIWPDTGAYLPALFQIGLVFILAVWLIGAQTTGWMSLAKTARARYKKQPRLETAGSQKLKRNLQWASVSIIAIMMLGYVALISGLFRYYFLAIGSGSMAPNLERGDLVLVEKSQDYARIEVGDVLVYRHANVVMVHRVAEKQENAGVYTFVTKGDANDSADGWLVGQGDIVGTAKGRVAAIGYPTLWLNELFNGGKH